MCTLVCTVTKFYFDHIIKSLLYYRTYHKDSYMAHRRDWKTGFEGRYRRTVSPSSPNRNPLCTNTNNTTAERRNPVTTTTTSPSTTTTTTTTTASTLRNFSTSQFVQSNNSKNLCDDKNINNGKNDSFLMRQLYHFKES